MPAFAQIAVSRLQMQSKRRISIRNSSLHTYRHSIPRHPVNSLMPHLPHRKVQNRVLLPCCLRFLWGIWECTTSMSAKTEKGLPIFSRSACLVSVSSLILFRSRSAISPTVTACRFLTGICKTQNLLKKAVLQNMLLFLPVAQYWFLP